MASYRWKVLDDVVAIAPDATHDDAEQAQEIADGLGLEVVDGAAGQRLLEEAR